MENLPAIVASITFIGVIVVVLLEQLPLVVAGFLGALILIFAHMMSLKEAFSYINQNHATLALLFGVMVLVRSFKPTKIFEYLATMIVLGTQGSGKLLLLAIVAITSIFSAVLPNATTVILLAPLMPPIAQEIGVDFVPLIVLMVFVANSAGLLTLVGDPGTFLVGDALRMSFNEYLLKLGWGGAIAIVTIIVMLPWVFSSIWQAKFTDLEQFRHPQVKYTEVLTMGGIIFFCVVTLFVIGESLPVAINPPSAALLGAALSLVVVHKSKIDTVKNVLRDIDWSTIIFLMAIFTLIGGLEKTGVIKEASDFLSKVLPHNIIFSSIILVFVTGILSSVIANIPLIVAMIPLLKLYVSHLGLVDTTVLETDFTGQLPPEVLPLFYAMLFGVTLGGNGTGIGASANIVGLGVAEQFGKKISSSSFLKYSLPMTFMQLNTAALFIVINSFIF